MECHRHPIGPSFVESAQESRQDLAYLSLLVWDIYVRACVCVFVKERYQDQRESE